MAMDGLNISVKGGEGEANIINWEGFNKTLGQIYTRDLQTAKANKDLLAKSELQLQKAMQGVRTPDMPKLKGYYDAFRNASLMMQDPKIKNNPQELAKWAKVRDDANIEYMSLAQKSKETQKRFHDIAKMNASKKGWGLKPEKFSQIWETANSLDSDAVSQQGLDTYVPYMNRVTEPNKQLFNEILGGDFEKGTKIKRPSKEKGFLEEVEVKGSKRKPHEIATATVEKLAASEELTNYYENMLENTDPNIAIQQIDQARQLDPNLPMQLDAPTFAAAQMILMGAPKETVVNPKIAEPQSAAQKEAAQKRLASYRSNLSLNNFVAKKGYVPEVITLQEKVDDAFKKGETKKIYDPITKTTRDGAVVTVEKNTKGLINIETQQPKLDKEGKPISGQYTKVEKPVDDIIAVKEASGDITFKGVIYKRYDGRKGNTYEEEIDLTPTQVSSLFAKEQKVPSSSFVKGVRKIVGKFGQKKEQPKQETKKGKKLY